MLPTVTELMLSPKVAFTQHFTTPLQVNPRSSFVHGTCCYCVASSEDFLRIGTHSCSPFVLSYTLHQHFDVHIADVLIMA